MSLSVLCSSCIYWYCKICITLLLTTAF